MRDLLKLKTLCHKDLLSFKQRVIVFSIFLIRKRKYFAENAKTSWQEIEKMVSCKSSLSRERVDERTWKK